MKMVKRFGTKRGFSGTRGFRRGAASFYIVAISTLILVIIATSFATVIISEIARTSNDDLSQSAYDSAMAGLEDAKVAYSSYRRCVEAGVARDGSKPSGTGAITCGNIRYWMEVENDCYTVGHILGKIPKDENTEVVVGSTQTTGSSATSTNQAYTCVKIETELDDYRVTLNETNKRQTMRAQVGTGATNSVQKIRLSWTAVKTSASDTLGTNYPNISGNKIAFAPWSYSNMANPPVVELQIVQTASSFSLSQFDDAVTTSSNPQTNRATMFLVPTSRTSTSSDSVNTWSSGKNTISAVDVAKTNDRTVGDHKPFAVYCNPNTTSSFYCSVEVNLPSPIGGSGSVRNNGTFMIAVSLPYQQPDTDFSIELICNAGAVCGDVNGTNITADSATGAVRLTNTQILMDSTGRANDLYRRVQARMETADRAFDASYPIYALQTLSRDKAVEKKIDGKFEGNFYF